MKRKFSNFIFLAGLAAGAVACGGGASKTGALDATKATGIQGTAGEVSKAAAKDYENALETFSKADSSGGWSETDCERIAKSFVTASEQQKKDSGKALPEALYNGGLAYMRCGKAPEAVKLFEEAKSAGNGFHRAEAQLILFEYSQGRLELSATISKLEEVIKKAEYQNAEALVSVAALQMERNNKDKYDGQDSDLDRARTNIQRALALDDAFMPAFNQLAIYYMELAKASSGEKAPRRGGLVASSGKTMTVNQQQLELAALVASQAVQKNPSYAPIHNTAGLILVEEKDYNGAVQSFGRARTLDPKFFEAQMNYAAVNLSFRGFSEAESAYRAAVKLNPKEYEAHLGLALALRGQINDSNADKYIAEAQKELDACKGLAPERAEAYYNEAILTQEYRAKGDDKTQEEMLDLASKQYQAFIQKAGSNSGFAEAVKRSKERTEDIQQILEFNREGRKLAAEEAAFAKQAAEEKAAADKKAAEEAKAPAKSGEEAK